MTIGLLWYDNDPKRSLEDKILAGAQRYQAKFGQFPNTCLVHPTSLGPEQVRVQGLSVVGAQNVLPHHFFLGVSESTDLR